VIGDLRGYVPPQPRKESARDVAAGLAVLFLFGALFMVGCLLTVGGS
jgi:hypothetical protein